MRSNEDDEKKEKLIVENRPSLPTGGVAKEKSPFDMATDDGLGSELNICCICLEKTIEVVLTCFHAYCRECIEDWRSRDPSCPMCRELENGRGSFDLLNWPDKEMREQIRNDLMRELTNIISALLGEVVHVTTDEESLVKG